MEEDKSVKLEEQYEEKDSYPSRKVVLPAMLAIYLALFLVAIDRTIVGTAVPAISNQFQSFDDIAWYEAGYLLPLSMFQLSFGRVYTYYSSKWILIAEVAVFEIGSIVSAAAPTSAAFIGGRAISGVGGAGITSGCLLTINALVPLQSRPKYTGGLGAVFGLASILGPLLGGYLTSVTWRWCFWINLPIGGVSLVLLAFLTPKSPPPLQPANTWLKRVKQLDPLGFILVAPATVCLLFALQFGPRYSWNDGRIIALFTLSGVLYIAFIGVQAWQKDNGTVPPKIFFQRSVLVGTIASVGIGSIIVIYAFYLPIWFQAIQGKSPQSSGLSLLPFLLSNVICVIGSGIGTSVLGYYTPFMIFGSALSIVGAALITTWEADASAGQWIGYQIIVGAGFGFVLQQPNIAAQTVLPKDQVSIGVTLLTFVQLLGGTVVVTICQTLLGIGLSDRLVSEIPNFDPSSIANQGATSLRTLVPADKLSIVTNAYNDSLRTIWYIALGLCCLVLVASLGMEWRSVKKSKSTKNLQES